MESQTKNILIAVAVCLVLMLGWNKFAVFMGWMPDPALLREQQQQQQQQIADGTAARPVAPAAAPLPEISPFTPVEGRSVVISTPLYEARLWSSGGFLESFRLKEYSIGPGNDAASQERVNLVGPAARTKASLGILIDGRPSWTADSWQLDGGDVYLSAGETGSLRLIGQVDNLTLIRELTFDAGTYLIHEKISVQGADVERFVRLGMTVGAEQLSFGAEQYNQTRSAWRINHSLKEQSDTDDLAKGLLVQGDIQWAGVMSSYFMTAVAPVDQSGLTLRLRYEDSVYRAVVEKSDLRVLPGRAAESEWNYWIGPKDRDLMAAAPNELSSAINMGWFSFIAKPLLWLLNFFYSFAGNYGVAIILLTLLIKIILFPLSHKSYKSMNQMKKLQPMMAKIRERHAGDREAISRETMALYKSYKVNPAGGCMPMFLQIPVFFGLYQALLNAIELRHASFISTLPFTDKIWLADLSAKDPYYITPVVMGLTMLLQQKLTPSAADPIQAKMMMIMPIVFLFLFINFPAGLVVYWLCNNVFSIAQQWWMLRKA
jgi:YidC/Oxa1 family membrane protein insertase